MCVLTALSHYYMKGIFVLILVVSASFSAACQNTGFKPSFSSRLDSVSGRSLLNQCSRATPENVSGFWAITANDMNDLENHFLNIDTLISKECCLEGMKVRTLEGFAFQYVGVIINKRKYIYINAFPFSHIKMLKEHRSGFDPAKRPVIVCDGGSSFWGALYDTDTKKFSQLSFNGVA